jgi:glycosyltransferase involved in cell wall biosynthesis
MRIAVIANTSWYLYNFRLTLMQALMAAGHEVVAVGPSDDYAGKLVAAGVRHRAIPLTGASVNPLRELCTVWALHRIFRDERVDVVLSYTPKGNIYGAMAAAMNGLRTVPNVSGLGRVFIRHSPLTWLVKKLYQFTFGRSERVFFQNQDDLGMFVHLGLVEADKAIRLPGSGVNLARFSSSAQAATPLGNKSASAGPGNPNGAEKFVFLLVARLLWDKGVGEYVEAARKVRGKFPMAEFRLLGFLDVQNPSAIPRVQVEAWVEEGVVRYLGSTDDVLPHLREADCVVLPSFYKEGVPRTLLEAAAMEKPIITTDASGCRDAVDDGVTGFLCGLRDAGDLADKMLRMIEMDRNHFQAMGQRGREKMMNEFDERIVINRYLDVVDEIAKSRVTGKATASMGELD